MTGIRALSLSLVLAGLFGCASNDQRLADELARDGLETRVDARGVTVVVTDVLFGFDSDELSPKGVQRVGRIAEIVGRVAPGRPLACEGHTDARGGGTYNFDLSLRRANRVLEALAAAGVERTLLRAEGFGETRPVAPEARPDGSDDPDARQRNRRVEVVIANP